MKYILISLLLSSCAMVGPGERGVRVVMGKASDDALTPGTYLWIPFIFGLARVDAQIQKSEVESMAATKDMQDVHAHVAVNWSMNPADIVKTYKEIGDEDAVLKRIIEPSVNEIMKSSSAKLTAEEVLTKRLEMKKDIDAGLKDRLATYGIKLYDVSIMNLKFSDGFTHAIEQKQIAEQAALQARYEAQKATQDANAAIEQAKGQAKSQELVRSSITSQILQQRAIEKWDGHFPQVMGPGTLPFININPKNAE